MPLNEESPTVPFPSLTAFAQSGVYLLWRKGVVVYVGQAVNMRARIGQHVSDGLKVFDAVSFVGCPVERLDAVEREHIRRLSPEYNQCRLAKSVKALNTACGRDVNEPWLSANDAATALGVNPSELEAQRRNGCAPKSRLVSRGRKRLYDAHEVRQLAARQIT